MSDWHRDKIDDTYRDRPRCSVCSEWWPCTQNELAGQIDERDATIAALRAALVYENMGGWTLCRLCDGVLMPAGAAEGMGHHTGCPADAALAATEPSAEDVDHE